jgi:hypothetical protein
MTDPDRLLSVKHFAELADLTPKYVRKLMAEDKLPYHKMGDSKQSRVRIPASALTELFRRVEPKPAREPQRELAPDEQQCLDVAVERAKMLKPSYRASKAPEKSEVSVSVSNMQ